MGKPSITTVKQIINTTIIWEVARMIEGYKGKF